MTSLSSRRRAPSIIAPLLILSALSLGGALCPGGTLCSEAAAAPRTWFYLPTGNGHGFQIFDRNQGKITTFLEHPYRYLSPSGRRTPGDRETPGVDRRDLAYDIYFGARVNGAAQWFEGLREVEYEAESQIIHGVSRSGGVRFDHYFFAPFGLEANAMVMLVRAEPESGGEVELDLFAKANLKLGQGRPEPGDQGEQVQLLAAEGYAVETGPGGGHALYLPIGEFNGFCGQDSALFNAIREGSVPTSGAECSGNDQVFIGHRAGRAAPGAPLWWGQAILFVNDTPNHPMADLFRDLRSPADVLSLWREFIGELDAEGLHRETLEEWERWRVPEAMPAELTPLEQRIWRQSDAVMRMGQIREAFQPNRRNFGMYLAALPIGEWHTGWVRDGAYAVVAMAMNGHLEEAKIGAAFYLNAEKGVFPELGGRDGTYRVSSCRYFGNGMEEADGNYAGPNLETDGWGLVLWAASSYLQYSCDLNWLDERTLYGDTVYEALSAIADDIIELIDPATGLPAADCSIWEVHWDLRQIFTYTAATQIRGLFDFAAVAYARGDQARGDRAWDAATEMLDATRRSLLNTRFNSFASHQNVANVDAHVDGSTVELLNWGLISPEDPSFRGTLELYDRLITGFGGYRRLEPSLSLTGGSGANEYDLSEWVLLDLRIGAAWRQLGEGALADIHLNKITDGAASNDLLIPELYEPNRGDYAGVVPMVGYGAGAWQVAQLERYGAPGPGPGVGYDHCFVVDPESDGGMMLIGDGGAPPPGSTPGGGGAGGTPGGGGGGGGTPGGAGREGGFTPPTPGEESSEEERYDWSSEPSAGLCTLGLGAGGAPLLLLLLLGAPRRRRARHS